MAEPAWPLQSHPLHTEGLPQAPGTPSPEGPRYRRLGPIGAGATGTVHLGWDRWLGRNVALKVPRPALRDHELLMREAKLAARLDHPAIATIHDVGEDEDVGTFFVMRLVHGQPLRVLIEQGEHALLLRALRVAAGALAHAHARGIVHRDLSPHNILVGHHGEVGVIDWGVAAEIGTGAGDRVGTEGFVAPEQAAGQPADPRADVWALGRLLQAAAGDGPPPELAAILSRALAPAPDRYPDAGALEADLTAWEEGRLVSAYHYTRAQHFARWLNRWRVPLGIVAVASLALLLQRAWDAASIRTERDRALAAEAAAQAALRAAIAEQARTAWRDGDDLRAAELARQALPHPLATGLVMLTDPLPRLALRPVRELPDCGPWRLPGARPIAVCLAPDHTIVLPQDRPPWHLNERHQDARLSGDHVVLLDLHQQSHAYHAITGAPAELASEVGPFVHPVDPIQRHTDPPLELPGCERVDAVAQAGPDRYVACSNGRVHRVTGAHVEILLPPGQDGVDRLLAAHGGVWGATHSGHLLRLDQPATPTRLGEPIETLRPGPDPLLLVHGTGGRLRLFDTRTGRWHLDLGEAEAATLSDAGQVHLIRDGRWLQADLPVTDALHRVHLPFGIPTLALSPHGTHLALGTSEGTLHRYPISGAPAPRTDRWDQHLIKAVAYTPDGTLHVSALGPGASRRLPPDDGPPQTAPHYYRRKLAVRDGNLLRASYLGGVDVLTPEGREWQALTHTEVHDLSATSDDWPVLLATDDGLWSLRASGEAELLRPGHTCHAASTPSGYASGHHHDLEVTHGPHRWSHTLDDRIARMRWIDGRWLAVGGRRGALWIFDADGALRAHLPLHDDRLASIAATDDWLFTAGWDGRVRRLALDPLREADR